MKALIIVDVQVDFTTGGRLAVKNGEDIIPLVNRLQDKFELVVATQDWHPHNHKSFASQHTGKNVFDQIDLNGLPQTLWPDHCVQSTKGAEFHPSLRLERIEAIFRKGMDPEIDSYSGFYDNGHRKATGMSGFMRERGVSKVYVVGLAGDYCVYFTAKDALKEGFRTCIIKDATRPIDEENFTQAMKDIAYRSGEVLSSSDI